MRILYDIFFIIFSLVYIPYLLLKRKLHRDFPQKFGFLQEEITRLDRPIWIHAVSVGEAAVASRLAIELKKHHPNVPVVVSTTTQTGNDMICKLGKGIVDAVFYYPVDISFVVAKVVKRINPRLYVMVETELWPNLLSSLHSHGVPVVMANGRISDNSSRNYRKISFITKNILSCIDTFCMQSGKDAERIIALGAQKDKVSTCGNMKFDMADSSSREFTKEDLGFSSDSLVLIAGSTHPPEEQMIIDMFLAIRKDFPKLKLVLAPRHIERKDAIKIYLDKSSLACKCFSDMISSEGEVTPAPGDVLLVDTIGHIKDIYSVATVVFVGGSLVDKGGQNPIEGARWRKPILFGPYMHNFREISSIFEECGAAVKVKDINELEEEVKRLLGDKEKRDEVGMKAAKVIEVNTGAVLRTLEKIEDYIVQNN